MIETSLKEILNMVEQSDQVPLESEPIEEMILELHRITK